MAPPLDEDLGKEPEERPVSGGFGPDVTEEQSASAPLDPEEHAEERVAGGRALTADRGPQEDGAPDAEDADALGPMVVAEESLSASAEPAPVRVPDAATEDISDEVSTTMPNDDSPLFELPGAGPGLVWMLNRAGVTTLEELAASDPQDLTAAFGVVGQLLDLESWIDWARKAATPP